MAPRRSARILASHAAPPLTRRAAFLRAVEAISVHGRLRTTTTASQRRRTTTTASQRRRTTTTASQRRAIQIAANQPPAEDPPVVNRGGINSRGTNRRGTNRRGTNRRGTNSLPVQDTAQIVTLLQNPDPQRGTGSHAVMGALAASLQVAMLRIRRTPPPQGDGENDERSDGRVHGGVSGRLYLRLEGRYSRALGHALRGRPL
ncbi:uncharacterized protein LOC117186295 [Drosophila miranda]|uniref:uncharacterized protein LOC117186295 n=1 Tax=Drosophila miranda TaxID=7229 RepID=UPI00143F1A35|nr:uncharacterized protein LOC117186295 [Drosophila miranda]